MQYPIEFTLAFEGGDADRHLIDFYDVSQALIGFQRSLALTAHLVLNDEIITQAPSLKGARIYAIPPEEGSWKIGAAISIAAGAYALGSLQSNSVIGHLVFSLYDYVISESLGVHVDLNKSLGQVYKEAQDKKIPVRKINHSQADSLVEKCSTAVREMHRPIYKNDSATSANLVGSILGRPIPLSTTLTMETYEFIHETRVSDAPEVVRGLVTSYNSNTYRGRIYVHELARPVAFELDHDARSRRAIRLITASLSANALGNTSEERGLIQCTVLRNTSKTGHLKSFTFLEVESPD